MEEPDTLSKATVGNICCVLCAPMVLGQTLGENFCFKIFNSIFYVFIFRSLFFLYYKGILAFIFEQIMAQEILCNK